MTKSPTNKILVALDLSLMDEYILSFLAENGKAFTDQKMHFIHVDEALASENLADEETGPISEDHLEKVKAKIRNSIPDALDDENIYVASGEPENVVQRWSVDHDIDLLVVGQKATDKPGVRVKRLVKKPVTSLLKIPEKESYPIRSIGVATDFSPLSAKAVKEAHSVAEELGAKLIGVHTYQVSAGYHKTGKDHWEFAEVMEQHAKDDAKAFWSEMGLTPTEMHYVYDKEKDPAECITQFVKEHNIDLLVISSKGRTAAASLLMGSVASDIIRKVNSIPVMVVKERNTNMDLLEALKEV